MAPYHYPPQTAQHFQELVDASPAMLWMTDENSRCTYLSKQWYEFTGRTPEQDLGFGWLENIHPDDRARTAEVYSNAVENRGVLRVDYRLRAKDGTYRWAVDVGNPRFDSEGKFIGYVGTVTDVHERIAAENETRLINSRFQKSAQATDLGVWYCDLPFDELIWNAQVKNHFWLPADARVTIETFYERIHPDDREKTRNAIAASNTNRQDYDIVYRTTNPADPSQIKFIRAVGWTDFDENGNARRFDGLTLDITKETLSNAELARAKAFAEAGSLAKSEFLANMSHEIRTPLSAILGFIDLLRDPNLPPSERERYFDTVSRNGHALTRIVDDVLDLAKVEAGKLEVEKIDVSFHELVREAISLLSERAKQKGLSLDLEMDREVPSSVSTDPARVRQILLNLVGNAVKFTSKGGVTIKVSSATLESGAVRIEFVIEDSGIGIDPLKRDRLFKPFGQADSSMTRKFGGTGLGLALSQRLARALGGEIELLERGDREGAAFCFSMTANPSGVSEKRETARVEATPGEPLRGLAILVVDDSQDNRTLVNRVLTKRGARVTEASNGEEGVAKAVAHPFDLILMDIQMPGLDGYDATRSIKQRGLKLPVIAFSAHAMKEDKERSLKAGCADHLTKPLNASQMVEAILRLTNQDGSGREQTHRTNQN